VWEARSGESDKQLAGRLERGEQLSRALSVLGLGELRASVRGLKGVEARN
jgi:hypothetical protein